MNRAWRYIGLLLAAAGCSDDVSQSLSGLETEGRNQASGPWFNDQAVERGIHFVYQSGHQDRYLFPEIMGGGAALADFDNDGDLDAYLVQGGGVLSTERPGNQLFVNDGGGRFKEHPQAGGANDTSFGMGAATGDYDNDGDIDLYVSNVGINKLYRNDGDLQFTDVTTAAGIGDPGFGASASFQDLDNDGDLDLFVTNYVNWSEATEQECFSKPSGYSMADYCWPTAYESPARDRLFRNNNDGTFTDVSDEAGLALAFGNGLGVVSLDANNDGLADVYVANDMTRNQLWLNQGGLRFVDEAMLLGCAVDSHGTPKSGMGVAAADYDDDGDSDIIVMNLASQTDSFFRNTGTFFEDATVIVGLATATRRYTRFGVALVDFDNDGYLDLYEANGAVALSRETAIEQDYTEPNLLLRGTTEYRFELATAGDTKSPIVETSRGLAYGDVDNDGGVDVLIVNRDGKANLLMNQVDRGNWIRFRVLNRSGSDALGAMLSVNVGGRRITRRVGTDGSYLTANDPRVHVGTGSYTSIGELTVNWPNGTRESFAGYGVGETVIVRQGEGSSIR